ncbi:MAG: cryptochrome/photolyase family protein [Hahellaceae bacterium]|nr:cryptochrome/photolyase family protein [Hahellaceae bacterium]
MLGDQLNAHHSWFKIPTTDTLYVIAELRQETDYVVHHVQKVCAFFLAMRHFAEAIQKAGHQVCYLTLDDTQTYDNLPALICDLVKRHGCNAFEYQRPDEYRLLEQLRHFSLPAHVTRTETDTEHFLLPFDEITRAFPKGRAIRMEMFYRRMRKRFDILMEGDQPEGGRWNYDNENRQALSEDDLAAIPAPLTFGNDVSAILDRIRRHGIKTMGYAEPVLPWPVTRQQAKAVLQYFCEHLLPHFGAFQDAMTHRSPNKGSIYHSRLSFALNAKLLHPSQVIHAVLASHHASQGELPLASVEGFIRQILGWREYVRGMYRANMPYYARVNHLNAVRPLPEWFWTGKTRMRCLAEAIGQSLDTAYAHHIQRLMVTGNFALLAGLHPDEVDQWYLGIYVDALEWVELPNTRGMSQFADGGLIASKPYAASGNYLNKMSDYCGACQYRVREKTGPSACPFNSLYWHFLDRHEKRFGSNPRMAYPYAGWRRMPPSQREAILSHAETLLATLDTL